MTFQDFIAYVHRQFSLAVGYVQTATLNKATAPSVTESCTNIGLQGNNRIGIPSCRPPGFVSLPNDYTQQIVMNMGSVKYPVIVGHIPVLEEDSLVDIVTGECALYSDNYVYEIKNNSIIYKWTNPQGTYTGTALTAENFNMVSTDIMNALNDIKSYLNTIEGLYNSHIHSVPGILAGPNVATADPTGAVWSPYVQRPEINEDLTAISQGKTLVADSGISPLRS